MNKIVKYLGIVFIVIFLVMFFTSSSGYYEYELNKKSNLTQESILQFEEDVKSGKEIDINDYLVEDTKDYSNNFTKAGLNISNKIETIFSEGVKLIFNSIGKFIED